MTIYEEIVKERAATIEREGYEWQDLIAEQASGLTGSKRVGPGEQYKVLPADDYRERLIRIAALAINALEQFDAKKNTAELGAIIAGTTAAGGNDAPK